LFATEGKDAATMEKFAEELVDIVGCEFLFH
jgi:hypothetical protein